MQTFSIRNIEILTGIKAHTLRMWEKRYDFFRTGPQKGRQRIYSNDDLKKLLCLSFLYHNGWKISRIAALPDDEIKEEVRKIALSGSNHKTYVQKLLQAAVDFNEAEFVAVLNELCNTVGLEKTIVDVCYPYLQCIGLLWDISTIVPAQEHFASYLIQSRLISETEKFSAAQKGPPEILLFCPENENHELPLLFLNYLLRKHGWQVLYLGKNINVHDLKEAVRLPGIKYFYLHLIVNFTGLFIDDYLEMLRKTFPDKIIYASGRGIEQSQRTFVGIHLLRRDEEIYGFVEAKEKGRL